MYSAVACLLVHTSTCMCTIILYVPAESYWSLSWQAFVQRKFEMAKASHAGLSIVIITYCHRRFVQIAVPPNVCSRILLCWGDQKILKEFWAVSLGKESAVGNAFLENFLTVIFMFT